ncbi:MAG: permease-like cell division protein FtsX [Nitrospinales bacterium]
MNQTLQFFLRAVRSTSSNIRSNRETSLVSVATITAAFSILGLFLLVLVNLNVLLTTWNRQVQLVIYLQDNLSKADRTRLENLIAENPDIESSTFVSRKMAWDKFKKTFSGKAEILQSLEFNPLPASFNLQFKNSSDRLESIRRFAAVLEKQSGVESLEYGEKWISRFETFMVFMRLFLFAVGGLLSLGLVLIVSNTIKLSIYSRKDEIELMYLIGARPSFIKVPFLIEGAIQGLLGALMAVIMVKCIHLYMKFQFEETIHSLLKGLSVQFISFPLVVLMIFTSMFIGWLGSLLAVNQFVISEVKK